MKWNATSVSAACLVMGVAGFVAGKVTQGGTTDPETRDLLSRSEQISTSRSGDRNTAEGAGSSRDGRASGSSRSSLSMEERIKDMERIVLGENALDRNRAMLAWIDQLSPDEFKEAIEKFRALGISGERRGEYAMLLTAWAELDPLAALAYTQEGGGRGSRTVLSAWANRDPESAIAWAESNYDGDGGNPYMVGVIQGLSETDTSRATGLLAEMPYSRDRGEALQTMIPHLLNMGNDVAKAWVDGLQDEQLKDGAVARISEEMARNDPEGTAQWLLANLGESSTRSVDEVFQEWAEVDFNAAAQSFESLEGRAARSRGLVALVEVQARTDPQAASDLIDKYPQDASERVVERFVRDSFNTAPELAVNQIGKIEDQRRQNEMYNRTLNSWLNRDQAAAERWISSTKLPDRVNQYLEGRNRP
ncbi:MAG: hypothetical protein ACSHX7_08015 [Luteolibacter sp.]